ncbi:uncharacterized protein LOC126879699 [Diabrotica virgifera virgifera]|uniref:Uncharacterized protein n=1 Tax=Diabrotica virgifera virgifera TaxID=50390 RepID=A0ABM5JLM1_DIAVI|nr:uncharacterized protein LOC126879699 [Diabrotica virgifera virgifera]
MKPAHLTTNELTYELHIRDVSAPDDIEEKRTVLTGLLSQETSSRSFSNISVPLSFEVDYKQALASYTELQILISEFTGTKSDILYKTFNSRFQHLSGRISRLRSSSAEEEKLKKAIRFNLLKLEGTLCNILEQPDLLDQPMTSTRVNLNCSESSISPSKPVPVYKWGIKKIFW